MAGSGGNDDDSDEPSDTDIGDTLPQREPPISRPLLPDAAEAYVPPRPIKKPSDHKTIENEPVRLAPDIDPQKAPTIRIRPERGLPSQPEAPLPELPRSRVPALLWASAAVMAGAALALWLRGRAAPEGDPRFAPASPVLMPPRRIAPIASFVAVRAVLAPTAASGSSAPAGSAALRSDKGAAPQKSAGAAPSPKPGGEEPWVAADPPAAPASAKPVAKGKGEEPWVQAQ